MNIAFFGSSLVSAYWNGAATYYRGIIRALARRGHHITFYEPDAFNRQQNRDIEDPSWAKVVVYPAEERAVYGALEQARGADVIVKASGVGVFDDLLEHAVLNLKTAGNEVIFWDVDAPATLDRLRQNPSDPFRELVPQYSAIFTYGGGDPVVNAYKEFGARQCTPIYNALDPSTHFPVEQERRFDAALGFLGNRLPDREARVGEFFLTPARRLPSMPFLLGGAGWGDKELSANVAWLDHVFTRDHNAFNCSVRMVLNVSRDSMARYGFSPATRVFEAAGAGACLITDKWDGIEEFFEPNREILVASGADDVVELLRSTSADRARAIGRSSYRRALAEHTYAHRAALAESLLEGRATSAGGAV